MVGDVHLHIVGDVHVYAKCTCIIRDAKVLGLRLCVHTFRLVCRQQRRITCSARELTLLHNRPLSAQINRLALDDAGEETRAPT